MIGDLSFLKGNIQPIILNSLYNGDKYGYEIAKEIKEKTENNYEIKQPTLYSYLKKLEKDNLIESYWGAESNGGRRRYYRLTSVGRATFEQYTAQWTAQRTVMDTLVDADVSASQSETEVDHTLLLGNRNKPPRRRRTVSQTDVDDQIALADRLATLGTEQDTSQNTTTTITAETTVVTATETTPTSSDNFLDILDATTAVHTDAVSTEQTAPITTSANTTQPTSTTTDVNEQRARFDIQQESAESFMATFDQHISQVTATPTTDNGDDYINTLFDIVGDQLDDVDNGQQQIHLYGNTGSAPMLVDVADTFAKSGIRMRIFNSNTAVYHSKKLMPFSKIICITTWLSYLILGLCMGTLALLTLPLDINNTILIVSAIAIVVPLIGTAMMIADPTRKVVRQLNPHTIYSICIIGWLAFVATVLAINTLFLGLKFSDTASIITCVAIPAILALMPLYAFMIYNRLSAQYTK